MKVVWFMKCLVIGGMVVWNWKKTCRFPFMSSLSLATTKWGEHKLIWCMDYFTLHTSRYGSSVPDIDSYSGLVSSASFPQPFNLPEMSSVHGLLSSDCSSGKHPFPVLWHLQFCPSPTMWKTKKQNEPMCSVLLPYFFLVLSYPYRGQLDIWNLSMPSSK